MGQRRTRDLRRDNGRRGIQEWDNGKRGLRTDNRRREIQIKFITVERDRKRWKDTRKGYRRSGDMIKVERKWTHGKKKKIGKLGIGLEAQDKD